MFCERCGLNFLPRQSVCKRCGVAATRHWLQLISLVMLLVAFLDNTLVAWFLLPQQVAVHHGRLFFRAWIWFDQKASLFGWVPLALGLLVWELFMRRGSRPKVRGWITRKALTFALLAVVAPFVPAWVPAGQPSRNFLSVVNSHPGLPESLAWGVVVSITALLCVEAETRDSLLGDGRVLSLVSLGILLLLLAMTTVGWSLT